VEVWALFDNGTAEKIELDFYTPNSNQQLPVKVFGMGNVSADVLNSARLGMMRCREVLVRAKKLAPGKKFLVAVNPFNQQVRGGSAGLAFALAFAAKLADMGDVQPAKVLPRRAAATGVIGEEGKVGAVNQIDQKIQAALRVLQANDHLIYPAANEAGIDGVHYSVTTIDEALRGIGVIEEPIEIEEESIWIWVKEKLRWLLPSAALFMAVLLYLLFLFPWPVNPSINLSSPGVRDNASWQDKEIKDWLDNSIIGYGGPDNKDALFKISGSLKIPLRYYLTKGLKMEVAVITDKEYLQTPKTELNWGKFEGEIWLDRRLPDAKLKISLLKGEKLLASKVFSIRDNPPSSAWSYTDRGDIIEIGYQVVRGHFPQIAAIHRENGALRLTYLPSGGWGTCVYPFAFWEGGRFIRGERVMLAHFVAEKNHPENLLVRLVGHNADIILRIPPPQPGVTRAEIAVKLVRQPAVDQRNMPGEAFQLVHLGSMHLSDTQWDSRYAYVDGPPRDLPQNRYALVVARRPFPSAGFIFENFKAGNLFGLEGGDSNWEPNAPAVEVKMDRPVKINGWVTPANNPDQENIALWGGLDKPVASWSYTITARAGVEVFDSMEAVDGWHLYRNDEGGRVVNVDLASVPGVMGNALEISYQMVTGEWLAIYKEAGDLSQYKGVRFIYRGEGNKNTLEFKLSDSDGTNYGKLLVSKPNNGSWVKTEVMFDDLQYWWDTDEQNTDLDLRNVLLHFAVSKKPGDEGGSGRVVIDQVELVK
jgi:hypothetical protein